MERQKAMIGRMGKTSLLIQWKRILLQIGFSIKELISLNSKQGIKNHLL